MRARMVLCLAKIKTEIREVRLNNKPKHMLKVSPKGTVPILVLDNKVIDESIRLSGPSFNRAFELDKEPDHLRENYGGEFGQRCLLSRRLIERGVRFVEVSHNLNLFKIFIS